MSIIYIAAEYFATYVINYEYVVNITNVCIC